ncbi:MAG: hypothetical protein MK095_06565 [Phycisphaerales bacterium]|nr:hypothetical protein [Phycisphaerales bacterium]
MNDVSKQPHHGTMILVFGILGLIMCFPLGIVAWIMGSSDLKKMRDGTMDSAGEELTKVGMILGIITTILNAIGILLLIIVFVIGAAAGAASNAGFLLGF